MRASEIAHASQAAEDAAERLRRIREADQVVPWLGISPNGWRSAQSGMGPAAAAVTLSASLKRQPPNQIAGGYLRSLTEKARVEKFTPVPMIKALLNRDVQDAR
ncbi:MAG: replication initiation protein RepC [Pseudomonadota bacterium]